MGRMGLMGRIGGRMYVGEMGGRWWGWDGWVGGGTKKAARVGAALEGDGGPGQKKLLMPKVQLVPLTS